MLCCCAVGVLRFAVDPRPHQSLQVIVFIVCTRACNNYNKNRIDLHIHIRTPEYRKLSLSLTHQFSKKLEPV